MSIVRYNVSVKVMRRIVWFLLLLTVPFQAAVGSTGFVCGHGMRHEAPDAFTAGAHASHSLKHAHERIIHRHTSSDAGAMHRHAGDHDPSRAHGPHPGEVDAGFPQDATADAGGGTHNDAGTCSLCSECSFSAAPASEASPNTGLQASPLKILVYVDPGVLPHVGDALFRPPRISLP